MCYDIDVRKSQAELGIMIGDREHWSKGYGTDSVNTLLDHIFTETPLERIYLHTLTWNDRARRSFAKSGFREVKTVRPQRDGLRFHGSPPRGVATLAGEPCRLYRGQPQRRASLPQGIRATAGDWDGPAAERNPVMKVLVTGASGFIGRRVVRRLLHDGHSVRALVRDPERRAMLPDTAETAQGDVLDPGSLVRACEGVDAVAHLAAVIRESGRLTFQRVNYEGTRNVLEAAEAAGVGRFVFASTIGATSDAALPYLSSRWMAEQDVARSTVESVILRFSAGFGGGRRAVERAGSPG